MIRMVKTLGAAATAAVLTLALAGCELGPKKVEQTGYRGTGGDQIIAKSRLIAQPVPTPPYALPAAGGPTAGQTYKNVKVLTNVSAERFNHIMASINVWVAPQDGPDPTKVGCNYCHNPENMASDEKYTKVVARRMLQMTLAINSKWSDHVKQTGVTCYTCHRGNAIPKNVWARADAEGTPGSILGNKFGQNTPKATSDYASLPYDPFTKFFGANNNIRVQASVTNGTGLYQKPGPSVKNAEATYALMNHMSSALNVNCTFCHNTDSFSSWANSRPQRAQAWYGIRMVRDIDTNYIASLQNVFPDNMNRKGPHGDVYKANCTTCHQGLNKPLGGVSMLGDYPDLRGPTPAPAATPPVPAAPAVGAGATGKTAK
jgi:photosynthetic reaction center cytochrome c subunit